jgi:type IV pilus assembly protein PilO
MPLTKRIEGRPTLEALFKKVEALKRVHRILIFAGTLFLLGGPFFYFVYMPHTAAIDQTEKEIAGLKQRIALTKAKAKNLPKFREEYARVEKQFQEALKILPDKREIPTLLAGISQLGIDSKLQFRLFSPGKEASQDFYVKIPVSIEVGGKYRAVALFFDKVRRMDRIVNITNISIKPKAPLSTDLVTKCTAITYRFKTKADELKEKKDKKKK